MKKTLILLSFLCTTLFVNAQSGPPAPGTGIYAIIDTNYQVGTATQGVSHALVTLKNTTSTLYTGVQFRVFYDKNAFSSATVALVGSTAALDLQYLDNNAGGYVTITLVYTGSSSTYTLANGETFDITFTHVAPTAFYALPTISNLTWTAPIPAATFPQYAANQSGLDTVLNLHNYGGVWELQRLNFHGTFTNVTGTPAKNLTLALEKKVKTGTTWTQHASYITDVNGNFALSELVDTTYYDVRLAIQGDTMNVGSVVSTADAQLINQWVLGGATPSGWDFYTGDVNESDNLTITDAYGVFGRISGRFTEWPNSVKDVKFFTVSEFNTITANPNTNYTATIPGTTNFYHNILPGQPDSVVFYVLVPGDANGTGYHMARVTPIELLVNPIPGVDNQIYNVIDNTVEYDFAAPTIEVNVPKLSVQEGNLVDIPVKLKSNGISISSMQFGLKYDETLLEFKGIIASEFAQKWLTYVNPMNGRVDWGGFDKTNKQNLIVDGTEIVTLQFVALKPQNEWDASPLSTTDKYAGDVNSKDLNITPTNGILQVLRMVGGSILAPNTIEVYPNPATGIVNIGFRISQTTKGSLRIYDLNGKLYMVVMSGQIPQGQYKYSTDLGTLSEGIYSATLVMENGKYITKQIIKQN